MVWYAVDSGLNKYQTATQGDRHFRSSSNAPAARLSDSEYRDIYLLGCPLTHIS